MYFYKIVGLMKLKK